VNFVGTIFNDYKSYRNFLMEENPGKKPFNLMYKQKSVKVGASQADKTVGPEHVCTQVL
jgi:hypothetical protein